MANKDLIVKLTFNSQDFENGLKNAKSSMKGMSSNMAQAGVSFKSLISLAGKFAGGLGLAISAGNLLAKNLKEIETVSDSVGRSQKMLNESIKTFFVSLNTGSLENFIGGLKEVVKAAKEAYDAVDNLGTYLNFSSADMAKNQASQAKARYMIAAIKKGEEQGDLDYWQKELKRLAGEAENIIDKEVKHYEDAISASDRLLFAKFKGREKELDKLKDKYTGTADKNELAQNRYKELYEERNEIIRLFGKNTNPNTARNSMYMDFMKKYGDELEFLEIVTKREKDLTEMNKLLIAQENKKNTLYNERRTNLKYLSQESGGGGGKTTSSPANQAKRQPVDLIPGLPPLKTMDEGAALIEKINKRLQEQAENEERNELIMMVNNKLYQQRIDKLNSYASAMGQFSNMFSAFTDLAADGSPWQRFGSAIGGVLGEISKLMSTYASLIAIESVAESIKAGNGIPFPYNLIAIAAAGTALLGIISSFKNSFKDAGSFASGGIVGGNSYTGDRLIAHVNSGEMIIPYNDWHNSNAAGNVHFIIEGSQLKGVLDNYDKTVSL